MTDRRSLIAALGIALAVLGLGFVLYPDATRALSLPRLGVVFLGVFALVEAVRSLQTRRRTSIDGAKLPDPEVPLRTGRPGDEFDEQVAALGLRWGGSDPERLRRRLRAAAVEAVAYRWRLSPDAASARVQAGRWTDDAAAAWFLGGSDVSSPPWSVRIRAVLATESATAYYSNRTAEAVVGLWESA